MRPSVLLITLDTTRADHCSAYGYARPTTPRLDALARSGARFEAAYAPTASTGPSHSSMFTGLLPLWHGVMKNGQVLPPERTTLAERLHAAGYRTAAVVSSFAVDHRFGLDQGFDSYDDRFSGQGATVHQETWEHNVVGKPFDRRADETRGRAVEWLRSQGYLEPRQKRDEGPPFFLWVHFFDPHSPYDPPPAHAALFPPLGPGDVETRVAAYDAEIHFADEEMGRLLDALDAAGRLDRTLVVVAGDHGEGLMQHGHMEHGIFIYEEAVRVPLVVRGAAGRPLASTISSPVELVDLTPTILDLAGLSAPAGPLQGRSLAGVLRDQAPADPGREIFLQRRRYDDRLPGGVMVKGDKYGLRAGRWKYIEARDEGTYELFDLAADPQESRNLRASSPDQAALMSRRLEAWTSRAPAIAPMAVRPEDAEQLRALGYVQ